MILICRSVLLLAVDSQQLPQPRLPAIIILCTPTDSRQPRALATPMSRGDVIISLSSPKREPESRRMEGASRRVPLFVAALPYLFGVPLLRRSHLQQVYAHAAPASAISRNRSRMLHLDGNDISTRVLCCAARHTRVYIRGRGSSEKLSLSLSRAGAEPPRLPVR